MKATYKMEGERNIRLAKTSSQILQNFVLIEN